MTQKQCRPELHGTAVPCVVNLPHSQPFQVSVRATGKDYSAAALAQNIPQATKVMTVKAVEKILRGGLGSRPPNTGPLIDGAEYTARVGRRKSGRERRAEENAPQKDRGGASASRHLCLTMPLRRELHHVTDRIRREGHRGARSEGSDWGVGEVVGACCKWRPF